MEHGCMVYTERAETATVSPGISHVTHKQRRKYTTSVDIHSESHATWTLWVCSRAENSAIQKGTTTTVAGQSGHIFCVVTGQFCCDWTVWTHLLCSDWTILLCCYWTVWTHLLCSDWTILLCCDWTVWMNLLCSDWTVLLCCDWTVWMNLFCTDWLIIGLGSTHDKQRLDNLAKSVL